jgi:polysaccharide biosynthesis PFTS motif protein
MAQSLKFFFFYKFIKKITRNYFKLKNNSNFKLIPEFEKDFINTNINLDFKYLKDFQVLYDINLNLTLRQMLYEKMFLRLRSYFIYSYKSKSLIFLFPIPNLYKRLINNRFKSLIYLNWLSWFLLSIFDFFRSLLKFVKFIVKSFFNINKKTIDDNNTIFFCNVTEKFLPSSDEEDSIINWYAKKKNINDTHRYSTILKKPFNCKTSLNFEYEKKIIPQIKKYSQLFKLIIKVSKLYLYSFLQLIIFNRWQYIFLLDEIIDSYIFEIVDKNKLCKEYVFINTQYVYRPLWTYIAEKKKSEIKFIFFSTGILQNFQLDYIEDISWSLVNWPNYHFWDDIQLDIIRKASKKNFKYEIENYIPSFDLHSEFKIPNSDICIFDDPPLKPYFMGLYGLIDEIYDQDKCLSFIDDLSNVLLKSNLVVIFKVKKHKNSLSKRYLKKVNNLKYKNIIMANPNISPKKLIEKTKLTISFPCSTPSIIAKSLNKKSFFYHPNKIRESKYLNHNIPLIYGEDNLSKIIKSIFN